jgi:hypothetical protein
LDLAAWRARRVVTAVVVADLVRHDLGGALVAERKADRDPRTGEARVTDVADARGATAPAELAYRRRWLEQAVVVDVALGAVVLALTAHLLERVVPVDGRAALDGLDDGQLDLARRIHRGEVVAIHGERFFRSVRRKAVDLDGHERNAQDARRARLERRIARSGEAGRHHAAGRTRRALDDLHRIARAVHDLFGRHEQLERARHVHVARVAVDRLLGEVRLLGGSVDQRESRRQLAWREALRDVDEHAHQRLAALHDVSHALSACDRLLAFGDRDLDRLVRGDLRDAHAQRFAGAAVIASRTRAAPRRACIALLARAVALAAVLQAGLHVDALGAARHLRRGARAASCSADLTALARLVARAAVHVAGLQIDARAGAEHLPDRTRARPGLAQATAAARAHAGVAIDASAHARVTHLIGSARDAARTAVERVRKHVRAHAVAELPARRARARERVAAHAVAERLPDGTAAAAADAGRPDGADDAADTTVIGVRDRVDANAAACHLPRNTPAGNDAGCAAGSGREAPARAARAAATWVDIEGPRARLGRIDRPRACDEETQSEDGRIARPASEVRSQRHAVLDARTSARRLI